MLFLFLAVCYRCFFIFGSLLQMLFYFWQFSTDAFFIFGSFLRMLFLFLAVCYRCFFYFWQSALPGSESQSREAFSTTQSYSSISLHGNRANGVAMGVR